MRPTEILPLDPGDRITVVGIVWNIVLFAVKLSVGLLTGSAGLIADGIHSASDMATDLVVLGGMRIARRRADESHPYGHGRYETLAGGAVAGALIFLGSLLAWKGGSALFHGVKSFPGPAVIAVAAISVAIKEQLYRRTVRSARKTGSAALYANAWHHRTDALSSIAVLAGGVGALLSFGYADHLAGLLVGLMVAAAGWKTISDVLHELSEGGLSKTELETIEEAIAGVSGAKGWHQLRGRRVGREMFIDVHVLVDPGLSVVEGHRVSMKVEEAIRAACRLPVNVAVHVEPQLDVLASHHAAND